MHDLARQMSRTFSSPDVMQNTALVHRITEGLPALLVQCLEWIRAQEWLGMDRLKSQELFEELAHPYIQGTLLAQDSLFPWSGDLRGRGQADEARHALEQAFRVLAPYRLFTQSHLRYYIGPDRAFEESLEAVGWSMQDLWQAVSGTALLLRPLNEPWQEIHPAIRRLLYRYYYTSDERCTQAHHEAREFMKIWAERQSGKEQVVGLVECLWHEAVLQRLSSSLQIEEALSDSARTLSSALRESSAFTLAELREYAVGRMRDDDEFQETVANIDGLFNKLVDIVMAPI
jgi:hypothetical protein